MSGSKESSDSIISIPANVKVEFDEHERDIDTIGEVPIEDIKYEIPNGDYHDESGENIGRLNQEYFDHTSTIQRNLRIFPAERYSNVDPLFGAESEHNDNRKRKHEPQPKRDARKEKLSNVQTEKSNLTDHDDHVESTCKTCGKTFPSKSKLTDHVILHMVEDENTPIECETCLKVYATKAILREHRCRPGPRTHLFNCRTCGESFVTKAMHTNHFKTHTEAGPLIYSCDTCGMSFSLKASLDFHASIHTEEQLKKPKEFKCDVCGKVLSSVHGLNIHKRIHNTGDKPYKCDECGISYTRAYRLRVHMRVHSKPYKCEECGKTYTTSYGLNVHMGVHTKPFKCKVCGRRLAALKTFIRHEARHAKVKP